MAGLTITESRKDQVTFTDSYYNASQKLIVAADDTTFDACKTKEDVEAIFKTFDSKTKVGAQNGTTAQFYVEGSEDLDFAGFDMTLVGYKNGSLAVQDLLEEIWIMLSLTQHRQKASLQQLITVRSNRMGDFGRKIDRFIEIFVEQRGYVRVLEGLQNTVMIAVVGLLVGVLIGTLIAS